MNLLASCYGSKPAPPVLLSSDHFSPKLCHFAHLRIFETVTERPDQSLVDMTQERGCRPFRFQHSDTRTAASSRVRSYLSRQANCIYLKMQNNG